MQSSYRFTCARTHTRMHKISVGDCLIHMARKWDSADPEKCKNLWVSTWTYLNILSYFRRSLEPLPLQGGRVGERSHSQEAAERLADGLGTQIHKGSRPVEFFHRESEEPHYGPPEMGVSGPHTYLSSFLEDSVCKI